jgi:gamma-glutamyl-gamma-aminobutyraldehyde dehydrogenase
MTTLDDWTRLADEITPRTEIFIDGDFRASASGATFDSVNPATGELIAPVSADAADVDAAVASARAVSPRPARGRGRRPPIARRCCNVSPNFITEHSQELAVLDSMDMGKLVEEAHNVDVLGRRSLRVLRRGDRQTWRRDRTTEPGNLALVTREPLGVIGAVTPWNFPLDLAVWKVAPALAAGNSVVLKPAEQAPLSSIRLAELAAEAGLPDGALNVVPGLGPTAGEALGRHPDVDVVAFTGSTATGKRFLRYAADSNALQVWLECGGKSPNLVFDDADLDAAVEKAIFGAFYNQGAVCSSNSRLLLHASIADEFLARLVECAALMTPGNPLDPASALGAIVDEEHTRRVLGFIERARSQGRILLGGTRETVGGRGCFIAPTIVADLASTAELVTEEVFGPVLAVQTLTTRPRPSGWPMTPSTDWLPRCGRGTSRGRIALRRAAGRHCVGQHRRRAERADTVRRLCNPGSAATHRCMPSTNTPA